MTKKLTPEQRKKIKEVWELGPEGSEKRIQKKAQEFEDKSSMPPMEEEQGLIGEEDLIDVVRDISTTFGPEYKKGMLPTLTAGKLFPKKLGPRDTVQHVYTDPEKVLRKLSQKQIDRLGLPEEGTEAWDRLQKVFRDGAIAYEKRRGKLPNMEEKVKWINQFKEAEALSKIRHRNGEIRRLTEAQKNELLRQDPEAQITQNLITGIWEQHLKGTSGFVQVSPTGKVLRTLSKDKFSATDPHEHIHKIIQDTVKFGDKDYPEALYSLIDKKLGKDITNPLDDLLFERVGYSADDLKKEVLSWIVNITTEGKNDRGRKILTEILGGENQYRKWQTKAKKRFGEIVKWLNNLEEEELHRIVSNYKTRKSVADKKTVNEVLDWMNPGKGNK